MGWIADFFRLAWGFLYWNARKTTYRLRRAHGRCPCHHPSDSGRAWETACAAVTHWDRPGRFQRVCPLLQRNPAGAWRCTVNRADVRPFWGRAAVFYGSALLILYLALALGVFVFLRGVGYGVTYPGVLWPAAWNRFTGLRSDFFLKKYQAASQAGDVRSALMALSSAYELEPRNYAAGRQLARFWQIGQPLYSDQVYRRLLDDHPAEAEATAQIWMRALLSRGDFPGVEALAAERILAAPDRAGAWLNACLFARRRAAASGERRAFDSHPSLPPSARSLLALDDDLARLTNAPEIRARLLEALMAAGDGLSFYHVCRELIARGFAQDALEAAEGRRGLLGARDLVPLRLDALARLGWRSIRQSEVEALLLAPPSPPLVELLGAHLIRYPDENVRALVFARVAESPLPADEAGYAAYLALFCAAGVGRDTGRLEWTKTRIHALLGQPFRGLDSVGAALLDGNRTRRIENYLPALQPLSLEVTYALFEHYAPSR